MVHTLEKFPQNCWEADSLIASKMHFSSPLLGQSHSMLSVAYVN